jgi:hypothetical protein
VDVPPGIKAFVEEMVNDKDESPTFPQMQQQVKILPLPLGRQERTALGKLNKIEG